MTSEALTTTTLGQPATAVSASRRSRRRRSRVWAVVSQVLLSLVALLFLVPIIWMVVSALKPSAEVFTVPPSLVGTEVKPGNFAEAWNYLPFGRFILNTLFVAVVGTMITLVASAMSAYAFARLNFRFRGGLFVLYLSTLIVPQEVIVIPMFLIMQRLDWVNSYQALFCPGRSPPSAPSCYGSSSSPSRSSSRRPPRSTAPGTSGSCAASSSRSRRRPSPSLPCSPSSRTGTASCGP